MPTKSTTPIWASHGPHMGRNTSPILAHQKPIEDPNMFTWETHIKLLSGREAASAGEAATFVKARGREAASAIGTKVLLSLRSVAAKRPPL
jgi:hypothetical protein